MIAWTRWPCLKMAGNPQKPFESRGTKPTKLMKWMFFSKTSMSNIFDLIHPGVEWQGGPGSGTAFDVFFCASHFNFYALLSASSYFFAQDAGFMIFNYYKAAEEFQQRHFASLKMSQEVQAP